MSVETGRRLRRTAGSMGWALAGKGAGGLVRLVSIPIILAFLGEARYGLIVVALSLSGYLSVSALSVPIGMVRHASGWLATGQLDLLQRAARSSFTFYLGLGVLNALIFGVLAAVGAPWFQVPPALLGEYRLVMTIAAVYSLFTWPVSVVDQLLAAQEELTWIARSGATQELVKLAAVLAMVWLQVGMLPFALVYLGVSRIGLAFNLWRWLRVRPDLSCLRPGWDWPAFRQVLSFSLGLFVTGLSFTSVTQLRPLLLAARAPDGVAAASDFQILFGLTGVLLMFNGVVLSNLLPLASKAMAEQNRELLDTIVFKVTRAAWVPMAALIFGLMTVSDRLLAVYVGPGKVFLAPWLDLWLAGFMFFYLAPIASVVIGSGRIRLLVVTSPLSAALGLASVWWLAPRLGIGAASVGTLVYFGLQFIVYHVYYIPRVLRVSSVRLLLKVFLPCVAGGLVMRFLARLAANAVAPDQTVPWLVVAVATGAVVYLAWVHLFIQPLPAFWRQLRSTKEGT